MNTSPADMLAPRYLSRNLTIRFSALLFLFLALLGGTYFAVVAAVTAKEHDSLIVNLAGRQRMLTQKYARDIDRVLLARAGFNREWLIEMKASASQTAELYETTLAAFLEGGEVDTGEEGRIWISRLRDNESIRYLGDNLFTHLRHVKTSWEDLKRAALKAVQSDSSLLAKEDDIKDIGTQTAKVLTEMDHVVLLIQKQSEAKLRRVESYMAYACIVGVALFLGTVIFVRRKIVVPLADSMTALETENAEREEAENEVRRAKDYTDNIIGSMIDMLVVVAPDGRITTVNEATSNLLGFREDEMIGQPASLLFSEEEEEEEEEDTTQLILSHEALPVKRTVLRRLVRQGFISNIEKSLLAKNGEKIPVLMSGSVMRDADGAIRGIVCVAQDITQRMLAEQSLRESELRFKTIFDNAPVLINAFDENGRCLLWNRQCCETFGWTIDEISAHDDALALFYPDPAVRNEVMQTVTHDPDGRFREWHPVTKDGETLTTVWANFRLPDGMVFNLGHDITERKRKDEELKQAKVSADTANQAKSEFLANMSHEIRTPMTAILGFAEKLLDSDQSESERIDSIYTIRRNGESLLGIINDILDLSKVEAGKMKARRVSCEPCSVIAEVSSLVRVQAEAKGLPLNIEYDGAIPKTIHTDPARLRQILINLVGNAIKFTETGAVRLVTRFVDDGDEPCLQFDVIDTGRGIPEEEKERLFQPFVQVDTSATRKVGGTGLGLTISKRFAALLGGDITLVETELGVGSTFRVTVSTGPLDGVKMIEDPLSATMVDDDANTVAQAPRTDLRGLRILFAEDGPDNQRLISFFLKKAGADVRVEENGKLALDAVLSARDEGKPFDLILMDMQMPVMDGYEATGQLRQKGYTAPIIALTAHAMEGDREKCIKAGCDDYATKPIDRKKLIDLILGYVQDGQSKATTVQVETPERPPLQGCRILLAEDNPTNQVLVVGILKKAGAEITVVKDGKLALDAALAARDEGNQFDIILMDIRMPLMGGDEATEQLREKGYTGKIISLTADTADGDQQRYISMGFDDSAWKPINRAKLIETIHQQFAPAEAASAAAT